ncbi:MAG: hypothetical protein R3C18_15975 [Planctomycetaceae bacterium]
MQSSVKQILPKVPGIDRITASWDTLKQLLRLLAWNSSHFCGLVFPMSSMPDGDIPDPRSPQRILGKLPISGTVEVLDLVKSLLELCEDSPDSVYSDMNSIDGRVGKIAIQALVAHFLSIVARDPFDCGGALDQSHIKVFETFLRHTPSMPVGNLVVEVQTAVAQAEAGGASDDVRQEMRRKLDKFRDQVPKFFNSHDPSLPLPCSAPTVARALAMAMDEVYRELAVHFFRQQQMNKRSGPLQSLREGDLFVAKRPTENDIFQSTGTANYSLAKFEDDVGQLPSFRIYKTLPLPVTISIDESAQDLEAIISSACHVGFACLGALSVDAFTVGNFNRSPLRLPSGCVLAETKKATGVGQFLDVAYKDQGALINLFDIACQHRVDVLIYPELSLDSQTEQQLIHAMRSRQGDYPKVVVLGSRHIKVNSSRTRNRLTAIGYGLAANPCFVHDKIGTFGVLGSHLSPSADDETYYYEGIERPRELTLLNNLGSPVGFLICKDVLQQSVLDTISRMSVRHLIVVAMSPKTEAFDHHLSQLSVRTNTRTLFSCYASEGGIVAAVYAPATGFPVTLVQDNRLVDFRGAPISSTTPFLATISLPLEKPVGERLEPGPIGKTNRTSAMQEVADAASRVFVNYPVP